MRPVESSIANNAESPGRFLRTLIDESGGAISVERFMHEALYHARHGYYSRRVRAVGRKGDFATSATLHPALAQAITGWAMHHQRSVTRRGTWHLIELGGGSGELAAEIRRALGWWSGRGLRYHLVEVSAPLRVQQQGRLRRCRNVQWHADIESALVTADGRALIFSNEFVDAFPCVQLARNPATREWQEVCVAWSERSGQPSEVLRPWNVGRSPSDLARAAALDAGATAFAPDQRVEIHFAYQRWLAQWLPLWTGGRMLTVDYGDTLPGLYHRRPGGTLRAYFEHQRLEGMDVYQRFGRQDLTADVNFTDLQAWGEAAGLATRGFCTQAEFLQRWLPSSQKSWARPDGALTFLLDPAGAGGAFKVLEQVR